jgi:hypothetical protein
MFVAAEHFYSFLHSAYVKENSFDGLVCILIFAFVFAGICLQKRLQPVHTILEEAARESGF